MQMFMQSFPHGEAVFQKGGIAVENSDFSTFSTGFSTELPVKSVDKQGPNPLYTKISTVLHKSVEIELLNITTVTVCSVLLSRSDTVEKGGHMARL